jgi:glucan phosphorylase
MSETLPARVAYLSMEIALEPGIPTYCGGLGVLAGTAPPRSPRECCR